MALNIGTLYGRLKADTTHFERGLLGAQGSISKLQGAMTKLGKAGAVALGATTAAVVVLGSKFEQQMAGVAAISGATDKQFAALTEQARMLGRTTEFTASQAAEGLEALARAGMSVEDSIGSSSAALLLAGTTNAGLGESTELLVSTMRQFGLGAEESTRIVDTMTASTRTSLLSFESLREGMKFAGTAGAGFGMTLEETVASLAAFRDLGLEGSLAGTNFRMAMIAASQATSKKTAVMKKYGMTMGDINPEVHSFADIVEKVGKAGISASDAMVIFGSRAGANMAMLASETEKGRVNIKGFTKELIGSGGGSLAMYDRIGKTVSFQMKLAISAFQDLALAIFDTFKEPLREALAALQPFFNDLSASVTANAALIEAQLRPALERVRDWFLTIGPAAGPALVSLIETLGRIGAAVSRLLPIVENLGRALLVAFAVGGVMKFGAALSVLPAMLAGVGTAAAGAGVAMSGFTAALGIVGLAVGAVMLVLHDMRKEVEAIEKKAFRSATQQISDNSDALLENEDRIQQLMFTMIDMGVSVGDLDRARRGEQITLERGQQLAIDEIRLLDEKNAKMRKALVGLQARIDLENDSADATDENTAAIAAFLAEMERLNKMAGGVADVAGDITDPFQDLMDHAKGLADRFGATLDPLTDMLDTAQAMQAVMADGMASPEMVAIYEQLLEAIKKMRAELAETGEETTGWVRDLGAVFAKAGNDMLSASGDVGGGIEAAMQGAQTGGVWGAIIAVVVDLLTSSEQFAAQVERLDQAWQSLSDTIGEFATGVAPLIGAVSMVLESLSVLGPVLKQAGAHLGKLAPILVVVASIIQGLGGTFAQMAGAMEVSGKGLDIVGESLFFALQGVGLVLLGVVWGLQKVWNFIIDEVIQILEGFEAIGADVSDAIANMESLLQDTSVTEDALSDLADSTYESALAQAENAASVEETTENLEAMNEQLTNVPEGFKVAAARFASMAAEATTAMADPLSNPGNIVALAKGGIVTGPTLALIGEAGPEAVVPLGGSFSGSGGSGDGAAALGGGGGQTVIIEHLEVVASDPERLFREIEKVARRKGFVRRGTPIPTGARYSTG